MAVPEQIPVVNYVADGVVKKFDVPFEYDQQSDLHLYVDGDEPTIDKYFFADNAFNFYIAPTNGQGVKIKRITPKERDTDYDLHTNTVRPKALNSDFDRLWYVLQEVFSDVGGLSQAVQDEIIARIQGDGDLLNQLTAEISARMLGDESVTEDLKNYVNQVVGAIINDPTFTGIDAKNVNDASGETQQQVNYNGGSKWHSRVGGYKENERVVLANGDIVKSTVDGNANNPNADMTGWELDKKNTAENIEYRNSNVEDALSRLKTYADFGHPYPQMLGYNNDAFADFAAISKDDALFLNGCLNLVKDLFGVSNNAAALSVLGNNSDNFRAQIVSGNSQTISNYGMSEDVLVYTGITGRASVTTSNPTYTTNSLTVTDSASLSGLKVGSVILTSDGYWSLVSGISGFIVSVEGWYKSGVAGTPVGTSAYLNHVDKTYLENKVLWIPSTYTGTRAVGGEWDFMCASPNVTEKNGLDFVLHDASTYDMDTAFIVRSAKDGKTWLTGFTVKGAGYAAFLATDGVSNRTPTLGSYADVSTAEVSQYLNGGNTYAKKCRFDPSSTVYPTLENRYGFSISGGDVTKNATSGVAIDLTAKSWNVFNNSAFSLILPSSDLVDGQTIEILLFGASAVTITSVGGINVNGASSYVFTPSSKYKRLTARSLGGVWYVFS